MGFQSVQVSTASSAFRLMLEDPGRPLPNPHGLPNGPQPQRRTKLGSGWHLNVDWLSKRVRWTSCQNLHFLLISQLCLMFSWFFSVFPSETCISRGYSSQPQPWLPKGSCTKSPIITSKRTLKIHEDPVDLGSLVGSWKPRDDSWNLLGEWLNDDCVN